MPMPAPRQARVTQHPGSTDKEIADEPNWSRGHNHRAGFRNRYGRFAGLTHDGDHGWEDEDEGQFVDQAMKKHRDLLDRSDRHELINFQDVMNSETVRDCRAWNLLANT